MDDTNEKGQNFLFQPPTAPGSGASDPAFASSHTQETMRPPVVTPAVEVEQETSNEEDQNEPQMERSVIKFGRQEYAVGLFWQPLQDVDDPIHEIRETMESDEGANLYAIHYGRAPQYGIGKKSKGHQEGQIVAGISVLDALSDKSSFVAVFKVEEGWWFIAVRNDLILPEEDVLYKNENEAKDAFFSMMAVPDWGYKIAPDSWHIDGTEEMDLEELIKNTFQARLLSLSAARGTKILLAIAALILLLVAVIVYLVIFLLDKATQTPTKIAPVIPQATIKTVEPTREEEKPWEKLVEVNPFLERCWSYAYQMKSMQVPGWSLNQITCTPQGISTGWNKSWTPGGRIAWLTAAYDEYKFVEVPSINESGTSATISIKFDDLPIVASTPTLSIARIRRELTDISQAINLPIAMSVQQITVGAATPEQQKAAQAAGQPVPAGKTYKYLTFSFSSSYDPPAWESFFDKFAALELVKIEYNPQSSSALSNNWKYEGRIYEK